MRFDSLLYLNFMVCAEIVFAPEAVEPAVPSTSPLAPLSGGANSIPSVELPHHEGIYLHRVYGSSRQAARATGPRCQV